ncbi:hypothetical protein C8T65DRAFT_665469 [Cerioporus squamosus]|nr:hypothetical protein C8T65DRAFT_665469 [Cerioporus squamosus]
MTAATAEAEAEDDADVEMDVDSDNFEEAPQLDVPVPVQGQAGGSAGQPHTPQRSRPPQGCYPTPPNTTSPIARYDSRVSVLHEDQVGSFVAGAMDPSSSASPTGEANSDLPGADNASCTRPQCQQLEQEYQRTRADLVAAQAEAAEQRDELQVLKLLQVDMEDRLSDAFSRNEHLADERDMYKKKHCGAEAALKGSQAVAHTMQSKMAQCLAQFRFM